MFSGSTRVDDHENTRSYLWTANFTLSEQLELLRRSWEHLERFGHAIKTSHVLENVVDNRLVAINGVA